MDGMQPDFGKKKRCFLLLKIKNQYERYASVLLFGGELDIIKQELMFCTWKGTDDGAKLLHGPRDAFAGGRFPYIF